ncbi:ABC transporter permease subunit [Pseudogracilibacillus auburnensis]|uniref:ABC transporter permease subunit n=1 Tax=Pseudogracilibacillus auburnensis TaxID=1494959 RepID=UPI001A95BD37|nr:ABC transporter permease subunit [Pseudogracilibacillus auburnensis]MBO1003886.1 ABC transporter permease subunit [Pseudogracilibacillus auburnensis]
MSNLLRVEFYKLIRTKVLWILLIISALFSFMLVSLFYMEEQGTLEKIEEFSDNITVEKMETDPNEEDIPHSGVNIFMVSALSGDVFINILFICIIGAFFITNEYSSGTIKNLVSAGYSRNQIYISKLIVYSMISIVLTLSFAIFMGLFGTMYFGFGEFPPTEDVMRLVKVLLLLCLYVTSFVSIAMLFVIIARGTGMALLLSFGFYLIIGSGLKFLSFQFTLFEKISKYSVYSLYPLIGESDLGSKDLFQFINVPFITILIFIFIGISYFKKQDIT